MECASFGMSGDRTGCYGWIWDTESRKIAILEKEVLGVGNRGEFGRVAFLLCCIGGYQRREYFGWREGVFREWTFEKVKGLWAFFYQTLREYLPSPWRECRGPFPVFDLSL